MSYVLLIKTDNQVVANRLVHAIKRVFNLRNNSIHLRYNDWEHTYNVPDITVCINIKDYVRKHFSSVHIIVRTCHDKSCR